MNLPPFCISGSASPAIERIGWVLVHTSWQFALIAIAAIVFLALMKRSSAALRHGTLMAFFAFLVMAPLCTWFVLGSSDLPILEARNVESLPTGVTLESPTFLPKSKELGTASTEPAPPTPASGAHDNAKPEAQTMPASGFPSLPPSASITETIPPTTAAATAWWTLTVDLMRPWLGRLVAVWALGLLFFSLRPIVGWWALRRLKTRGLAPVPESIRAIAQALAQRLGLPRKVEIFQSYLAKTPLVVGYFQPVILLPFSVVAGIPVSQLESILIHELAHVRRHDFLINVLQMLVETVFFYHPAVWFLSSRIRIERENCCDDLVIGMVEDRAEYGRALLAVEELRGKQSILALGATHGSLLDRVRRILAMEPRKAGLIGRWPLLGLAPLCLGLGLLFGPLVAAPIPDSQVSGPPHPELSELERPESQNDDKAIPVAGRILMADGSPATGTEVLAVLLRPTTTAEMRRETKVDAEGRFRLTLPALPTQEGLWTVSAHREEQFGKFDYVSIPARNSNKSRPELENLKELKLQPGHRMEGWVLAEENRKPLTKATVWSDDGQKVQTDAQGSFILQGLSKDVHRILVTHPNAARTRVYVDLSEQKIGRVKVLLPSGGTIQGEVTQGGQPVKDGHVCWGNGGTQFNQGLTEPIDSQTGKFSFGGLPYNRLLPILWFNAPGMETETTNLLVVRPGQPVQQIKMALEKTPFVKGTDYGALKGALWGENNGPPKGSIRGRVLQDNGEPVTEFTVSNVVDYFPYHERGQNNGGGSFFSEDGTFAMGQMDAGKKYAIAVTSPTFARTVISPITARVFNPATPNEVEVTEFRLKPATLQVDMVVRDAATKKTIPDAMVCFKPDVWYRDDFSWNLGNHGAAVQWSDQNGKMLWDRMEIDKGIFFVKHTGYGRAVLPWRIAKAATGSGGQTRENMVPENRRIDSGDDWEVVYIPDPVRPLKRNEASGRYEAVLELIPESILEVKINNANGRDLKWLVFDAEQMSLPGSKEARSAGRPLIQRYMEELPGKDGVFRLDGLNPGPAKWTIRDQVDEHNGVVNEQGNSMAGLIVREINLTSGVNRVELDLPPRPPAKPVLPEKKEPAVLSEAQMTEFLDRIDSLKNEKNTLLLNKRPDHPEVKKIQASIEDLEEFLKKSASAPIGSPIVVEGPLGRWRLEGGAILEMTSIVKDSFRPQDFVATLSVPGLAKKTIFDPRVDGKNGWAIGWIKGGTTLWAVTRVNQALKIREVRFGQMDRRIQNEVWTKETTIPWVGGQLMEDSGMPNNLWVAFSRWLIGFGPIIIQGPGKWILDENLNVELKERKLIAPLVGPAKSYVGVVRRHASNEPVGEIALAMVPEKDSTPIVIGWYAWTNIWVAQKNGSSAQLSRFDWTKPKDPGPTRQVLSPADDFPRGVIVGGLEIPVELARKMAEQFLAMEGKKKQATQPPASDPSSMRPASNSGAKSTSDGSTVESDPLKNALALLRERVQLNLEAFQSGNAPMEEVLAACKDLAELEPAETLTHLKTMQDMVEAKVKAGTATKRDVLAVRSTYEVLKLRSKPATGANSSPKPPENPLDPQVITTKGSWKLERGIEVEVIEQTFDAPIIGTFKQNVALFRRTDTKEKIQEIRLGLAEEKTRAYWAIGWMPGRESLWVATEHDRTQQLTKYRMANSQLAFESGTSRDLGSWNRDEPINSFGIPQELGYEMASRFGGHTTRRRPASNDWPERMLTGSEKEALNQVKDLQGSWAWLKHTEKKDALPSQQDSGNSTEANRLIHLIVREDQVRLIVELAEGPLILDKSYTVESEKDSQGMTRLLLRSQNDNRAVPFQFEVNKNQILSLSTPTQATSSSSRWTRIPGEEKLKGTWALVSGKPIAIGGQPVPADIKLELAFHDGRYDLRTFREKSSRDSSVKQFPRQDGSFHLTQSSDLKTILHLYGSAPAGAPVVVWGSHTMRFPDDKTLQFIRQNGAVLEWKRLDGAIKDSAAKPRKP